MISRSLTHETHRGTWGHACLVLLLLAFAGAAVAEPLSPVKALEASNAKLHRFVLDNGLVCLVKEDHSAPVAAVQFWVGTGAINEGQYLGAGLSHFVEHMIFKGTPTRAVGEITKQISDAGGKINAYTSHDHTMYYVTIPSKHWETGFDALADAMMNASFPEEEWAKERDVILREFAMGKDDPRRVLGKLMWATAYRVHPYRFPVIGYEDVFRSTTRDDLANFFSENYVPDNMIVVVAGDVDTAEVEARVRETLGPFERRARPATPLPREPRQLAPRFARRTGAYEVSRLHRVYHTTSLNDPDTPALDVLASIVGAGRSSRLVSEIKEEQQLVHSISAWSATPKDPGLFGISATFDPTNETAVTKAIEDEIARWISEPFTQEEIDKASRMVLVSELSSLETMDGQARNYGSGEYFAADPKFSETYLHAVESVTPDDLTRVAAKYLAPENRTLVILSPEVAAEEESKPPQVEEADDISKRTLPGGTRLLVREDSRLPFVYICATMKGGLLSETEKNNGITQLMSELLTRGTSRRSAEDIAETVEQLGGSLSTFAGRNSFGLRAKCLASDAETFMELLAECLIDSTFPPNEIEKARTTQLAEIQQLKERPFYTAQKAFQEILFPGHPYRWVPAGSEESVTSITREDLLAHFQRLAKKGGLVLSVFGDIPANRAEELTIRYFADMPAGRSPEMDIPEPQAGLPEETVQEVPKEQTIVLAGYPGIDVADPRRDALELIRESMNGLASTIGVEVREKRGLVYYVGAFDLTGLEPGFFALYAGTRADQANEVRDLMTAETRRVADEGLTEEELSRAKAQVIAEYEMSLQDNGGLALTSALDELYGLGYDNALTKAKRIGELTNDDIRSAAASLFDPKKLAVSMVFPENSETDEEKAE